MHALLRIATTYPLASCLYNLITNHTQYTEACLAYSFIVSTLVIDSDSYGASLVQHSIAEMRIPITGIVNYHPFTGVYNFLPASPSPHQPLQNITGIYGIYKKLPEYTYIYRNLTENTSIYRYLQKLTEIYGPLMISFHKLLILCF
jgi:hypothetical protein